MRHGGIKGRIVLGVRKGGGEGVWHGIPGDGANFQKNNNKNGISCLISFGKDFLVLEISHLALTIAGINVEGPCLFFVLFPPPKRGDND